MFGVDFRSAFRFSYMQPYTINIIKVCRQSRLNKSYILTNSMPNNIISTAEQISTRGHRLFAECPKHSAKPQLHSAKGLPSAALGKPHTAIVLTAKQALHSAFFEHSAKLCHVPKRPRQNKVKMSAKRLLTEDLPSAR